MAFVKGFLQFWYDFIIGDDWKIALAVALVLAVGALIVIGGSVDALLLTPLLAVGICVAFITALLIDVRGK